MTKNVSYETSAVSMETAIAVVCRKYSLAEKDLLEMFEVLDCVAPEQKAKAIAACTSFAKGTFNSEKQENKN